MKSKRGRWTLSPEWIDHTSFCLMLWWVRQKKDGDKYFDSITAFFMAGCSCPKGENGYHKWSYSICKCKDCKYAKPAPQECSTSMELVTVDQLGGGGEGVQEVKPRNRCHWTLKQNWQNVCRNKWLTKELYKKLCSLRKDYCTHKYLVYHDNYQWPRILATIPDYGPIYHMDLENMAQMHKYEVQSAHFNKRNYSLHCTDLDWVPEACKEV